MGRFVFVLVRGVSSICPCLSRCSCCVAGVHHGVCSRVGFFFFLLLIPFVALLGLDKRFGDKITTKVGVSWLESHADVVWLDSSCNGIGYVFSSGF